MLCPRISILSLIADARYCLRGILAIAGGLSSTMSKILPRVHAGSAVLNPVAHTLWSIQPRSTRQVAGSNDARLVHKSSAESVPSLVCTALIDDMSLEALDGKDLHEYLLFVCFFLSVPYVQWSSLVLKPTVCV